MSDSSPMLLIGVGGAGCAMVRGVRRAFGESLRYLATDTDATSAREGETFALLGGDRLSGHGSGGDFVSARLATEDSVTALDEHLENVRLAVILTALGGGTGGGATMVILKHLQDLGIPSVVFATTPFACEGPTRQQCTHSVISIIEDTANASFFLPLDKLIGVTDNLDEALRHAVDTIASGVTLFWRLVEKPGYIKTDTERIRHLVANVGRGRFATVTVQGEGRAAKAVDSLLRSPLLAEGCGGVGAILCGVLAGDDLRLSEIGEIADGIRKAFGEQCSFELATVNDEATFSGRLSVVTLLFASAAGTGDQEAGKEGAHPVRRARKPKGSLSSGPQGRGRFNNVESTIWNGEDLDTPTYIRKNINLDF